jgi:hypothetical protein
MAGNLNFETVHRVDMSRTLSGFESQIKKVDFVITLIHLARDKVLKQTTQQDSVELGYIILINLRQLSK